MAALPTFPTDSLYKFIALFGLVLLGFGLWYPEEKFSAAHERIREANKTQSLAEIRIDRKKAQVDRLSKELSAKLADLSAHRKLLDETRASLDSKRHALAEESARMEKSERKSDIDRVKARTESLTSEINLFAAEQRDHIDTVNKLISESEALRPRQDEVLVELASDVVILKSSNETMTILRYDAAVWYGQSIACIVVGLIMIAVGFRLWYVKIQVYQDAILRKQASAE